MAHLILITGKPGVGKTTVVKKVLDLLRAMKENTPGTAPDFAGFVTKEVRAGGGRTGFEVEDVVTAATATLATTTHPGQGAGRIKSMGRYFVHLDSFEDQALESLQTNSCKLVVIDELGKMESFSGRFKEKVIELCRENVVILATGPCPRNGQYIQLLTDVIDACSSGPTFFEVDSQNRDLTPEAIVGVVTTLVNR